AGHRARSAAPARSIAASTSGTVSASRRSAVAASSARRACGRCHGGGDCVRHLAPERRGAVENRTSRRREWSAMDESAFLERISHIPVEPNPALLEHAIKRQKSIENRIADRITTFAGSMQFVYIHMLWFGLWIGLGVEHYPYGLLTMIVSLEAIFLSTFVMISQNRADAKRQVIADQEWKTVQREDQQNNQLLDLSRQILELTKEVRALTAKHQSHSGSALDSEGQP